MRLAIDTTAEACSVALECGNDTLQRYAHAPRRHGELLLPFVDELLAEAGIKRSQLSSICTTRGPGSFTSLRMGFSVAVAMGYGLDIPVYPVSSLEALAYQAIAQGGEYIVSALDARMGEVYIGAYQADQQSLLRPLGVEQLLKPDDYQVPVQYSGISSWYAIGNGFIAEEHALSKRLDRIIKHSQADAWPQAQHILALAKHVEPVAAEQAQLIYLRNQVVQAKKK